MAMEYSFGCLIDPHDHRDMRQPLGLSTSGLPSETDLRPLLPNVMNQGSVNGCVGAAFAPVAQNEFRLKGATTQKFSWLALYWGARRRAGFQDRNAGCFPRDACIVMNQLGLAPETYWPSSNSWAIEPSDSALIASVAHRISSYHRVESTAEMMAELSDGHAVMYGFQVPANFLDVGNDGNFTPDPTAANLGGHAVVAVGYKDGRVLTRNSWGIGWGMAGHFWMPFNSWDSDLVTDAWVLRA